MIQIWRSGTQERMTEEDFARLAEEHMDMVYRVCLSVLGHGADAEDACQNVMVRLYRAAPAFESEEHARRWLCRVAVNEARRLLSAPWRRRTVGLDEALLCQVEPPEDRGVLESVWQLPEKYRVPIYFYYYEGYSTGEIARILRCVPSTVQTRLARGREKLKQIWKEDEA